MRRPQDVVAAVELGVPFVGFVLATSLRQVSWSELPELIKHVNGPTQWVAVTVDAARDDYKRLLDLGCAWIQLHGKETPEVCEGIAANLIKAVRAGDEAQYTRAVKYLLYDGLIAGSGEAWAWQSLKPPGGRPFFLAGGLHPDNVAEALRTVRPDGVDVASGIEESPGVKSLEKMRRFLQNVCV